MSRKILSSVLLFLAVPAGLIWCMTGDTEQTALLSTFIVAAGVFAVFLQFEHTKPRPRDLMPTVVLTALCVTGRMLFAALPNFKPVSAIVIMAGLCFGRHSGFLTGALSALISNLFFGQGAWTPWQMYAWGLMGYGAGMLSQTRLFKNNIAVLLYGAVASFGYGFILNSWYLFSFLQPVSWPVAVAAYGAGFVFDISHAVSTVVFLSLALWPWRKELGRIRQKYGLMEL